MNYILTFLKKHYILIIFLAIYTLLIASKLIQDPRPFFDFDESLYIQTGREMFQEKYFWLPIWMGEIWLDKPPLIPFLYWSVAQIFFFIPPEISTRLFSLFVAAIVLGLAYKLYLETTKQKLIAIMSVILTAFTPLFLQRAQTVNLDIFILLGWVGYIVFFNSFALSTLFLFLGVMSKSLIGFYPLGIIFIYHTYLFIIKSQKKKKYIENIKKLILQGLIAAVWFVLMFFMFGKAFWEQHIIESHFKRVTASIESHFGQRTYYIDLMIEQIGIIFFILALIGIGLILYNYFLRKKWDSKQLLMSLYLLPWFFFLNITKTKIFWYLLPTLPQFGFLASVPVLLLKKNKYIYYSGAIFIISLFLYNNVYRQQVLTNQYSDYSDHYYLSLKAKDECSSLDVLVPSYTRETYQTLSELDLTITTTDWWGEHPSIVYYFEKPVSWSYSIEEFNRKINILKQNQCIVATEEDLQQIDNQALFEVDHVGDYYLFKNRSLTQ